MTAGCLYHSISVTGLQSVQTLAERVKHPFSHFRSVHNQHSKLGAFLRQFTGASYFAQEFVCIRRRDARRQGLVKKPQAFFTKASVQLSLDSLQEVLHMGYEAVLHFV